jgi:hypothetical protein
MRTSKNPITDTLNLCRSLSAMAAVSVAAVGCATVDQVKDGYAVGSRNYKEPDETAPHALARFSSYSGMTAYPNASCASAQSESAGIVLAYGSFGLGARGLDGQRRGLPGAPAKGMKVAEIRIPAEQPFTVSSTVGFTDSGKDFSCTNIRTFTPTRDAQYQITPVADSERRVCALLVFRMTPTPEMVPTEASGRCAAR